MFSNDRLRQRRIDMGLTQEEVGDVVGISRSAVQKHERGIIKNVYTSTVELFAKALRCSPAYLMCWTDDPRAGMDEEPEIVLTDFERDMVLNVRQLNEEGAEKVADYIADIVASGRYKKDYPLGMVSEA